MDIADADDANDAVVAVVAFPLKVVPVKVVPLNLDAFNVSVLVSYVKVLSPPKYAATPSVFVDINGTGTIPVTVLGSILLADAAVP